MLRLNETENIIVILVSKLDPCVDIVYQALQKKSSEVLFRVELLLFRLF